MDAGKPRKNVDAQELSHGHVKSKILGLTKFITSSREGHIFPQVDQSQLVLNTLEEGRVLEDADLSSVDLISFVGSIEEEFGINFVGQEIHGLQQSTIDKIAEKVMEKIKNKPTMDS